MAMAGRMWAMRSAIVGVSSRMGTMGTVGTMPAAIAMAQSNAFQAQSRWFCAEAANPTDRKYAKSHEWCKVEDDVATMGITAHAAGELGDVVFVELPQPDEQVTKGESCASVESVKASSDIYAPVSGKVIAVNKLLDDEPGALNADAFGKGWMIQIKMDSPSETEDLMDADAYTKSYE